MKNLNETSNEYVVKEDLLTRIINEESSEMFINAIKELAANQDNLDNLKGYLSRHFKTWLTTYANDPYSLATEMKHFAEIEIK